MSLLSALVAKSLVRRTAAGRYDLHDLVRQYAAERLNDNAAKAAATRDRHSRYYLALLQKSEAALFGHRQRQAVTELNADLDNLRAAWHWAAHQPIDLLRPSARALYWYYDLRNLAHEGATLFDEAVAQTPAADPARDIASGHWRAFQAMFIYRQNRLAEAKQIIAQSLILLEQHAASAELIDALWIMGQIRWARGEFDESARCLRRALALSEVHSPWQTTICCILLGVVEYELGNYAGSYRTLTESLTLARAQGDPTLISYAISSLSRHADQPERIAELEPLLREGCQLAKESGNRFAVALSLALLAQLIWAKGDRTEARRLCQESIAVCRDQGDDWGLSASLNLLGNFELMSGNAREAQIHFARAIEVAARGGFHANILDVMVSMATAHMKTGDARSALELVSQVLQDPTTKHPTHICAEELRAEAAAQLSPHEIETIEQQTKSFDQVVAEILRQFG